MDDSFSIFCSILLIFSRDSFLVALDILLYCDDCMVVFANPKLFLDLNSDLHVLGIKMAMSLAVLFMVLRCLFGLNSNLLSMSINFILKSEESFCSKFKEYFMIGLWTGAIVDSLRLEMDSSV